jgi:tRNA threonylcarbamoyladenosine biosynthesis protein TsaE
MLQSICYSVVIEVLRETERLAQGVADSLVDCPAFPTTIALIGSLGSGKTQWSRYFCQRLGVAAEMVTSPTYVLLQRYRGTRMVHHLDLYRLQSAAEVWDLGLDELVERPGIVLIEWADRFPECLPEELLKIEFEQDKGRRAAVITASGSELCKVLERAVGATSDQLKWKPLGGDRGG